VQHLSDIQTVQADFDRIALVVEEDNWNHNNHYHKALLKHMPTLCDNALEIGCGTGAFARLIAERAEHVLALDLAPQMIQLARERSVRYTNIDFQCMNVMEWDPPAEQFDYIASIATFHHLPMEDMLVKVRDALKVNGTLVILDLFHETELPKRLLNILSSLLAAPLNLIYRTLKNGRMRPTSAQRAAWVEHGKHDSYLTISQVQAICSTVLPGAKVSKHLFWRYSIVWKKI
jgi:ubiquinone/menaquinone biosynthesis C-methylase UbiE